MRKRFKRQPRGSYRNLALLGAGLAVALLVLAVLQEYTRDITEIGYSAFISAVEHDQVQKVYITGNEVTGEFTDHTRFETVIADTPQTWDVLRAHNVEVILANSSSAFSPTTMFLLAILVGVLFAMWFLFRQNRNSSSGGGIFSMGKSRARVILPSMIQDKFTSVAGAESAKEELQDVIDFLRDPKKFQRLGAKVPRGVLLIGDPGTGKTLLARAVAGEARVPFFSITGSDFMEVFVGVGASRIRDLFAQARRHAPSIIFIDEIDAIGRQRGSGLGSSHDEREQTLNQLLTEMDGFERNNENVIVVAATNQPEVLDGALLRPGRFDRRVQLPYPDFNARQRILELHAERVKLDENVDFARIATDTQGFTGADLGELVNKAATLASKAGKPAVTQEDFDEARARQLEGRKVFTRNQSSARMFMPASVKERFSSVAGMREQKKEIQEFVEFLQEPQKFTRLGARIPHGALIAGPPGTGKTLLARAVAGEAGVPFFSVGGSEFVEVYVGTGAARVRELFEQARKHAPCIIFIDEIDAVGAQRMHTGGGSDEYAQTLNQLLAEMDGFRQTEKPIVVLGATNRPDMLDRALLRPGRLDRRVDIPMPDQRSRHEILQVHAKGVKLSDDVDLEKVARGTPGFSGAELRYMLNEAAIMASRDDKESVGNLDIDAARDKITLGLENSSMIVTKEDRRDTAYHEAGHAIVILMQPEVSDPLYKITVGPRGCTLGVTHTLPERDKPTSTEPEMRAFIARAMGGRIAEELFCKSVSNGAHSDFLKATDMVRHMVCSAGMSPKLGKVIYGSDRSSGARWYSQKTAEMIDEEVRRITNECYDVAKKIIVENKDKVEKLVQALLEKETLFAHEAYELLGLPPREDFRLTDEAPVRG